MSGPAGEPAVPAPAPRRRWWHHWKLILAGIVVTPALLVVLFAYSALHWSYSQGERAGTLQKFSKKGWLCKTWEGELMQPTAPGVAPTVWTFTVRDAEIARQVNFGLGRHVVLRYQEHRGVPTTCFGDTPYFVVGMRLER
ncbi:MAG: hypothetical protein ACHQU8_09305 [Gemmatimonadales bacterium]